MWTTLIQPKIAKNSGREIEWNGISWSEIPKKCCSIHLWKPPEIQIGVMSVESKATRVSNIFTVFQNLGDTWDYLSHSGVSSNEDSRSEMASCFPHRIRMRELSHSTSGEEGLEKLVPVIFASKTNQNFDSLILSSLSIVNGGLK